MSMNSLVPRYTPLLLSTDLAADETIGLTIAVYKTCGQGFLPHPHCKVYCWFTTVQFSGIPDIPEGREVISAALVKVPVADTPLNQKNKQL